ncbi:MAG: translocation/assembly module TamB domain-containing protein [Bacteroidota bacterium]
MNSRVRKTLRSLLKILAWTIGTILSLLVLIIVLIRIPAVQNKLVGEAEKYLENTLQTKVDIGGLYINFPKTIELTDFYLEDTAGDTLVAFEALNLDTDLWALLNNTIKINTLRLDHAVGKLERPEGSEYFNYQFIIHAFASKDTTTSTAESKAWNFNIEDIRLGPIEFTMIDAQAGMNIHAHWDLISIDVEELNLDEQVVAISDIVLEKVRLQYDQTEQMTEDATPTREPVGLPDIQIDEIAILESSVSFSSGQQVIKAAVNELNVSIDKMNLPDSKIELEELQLNKSSFYVQSLSVPDTTSTPTTANPWKISLSDAAIDNTNVKVDLDTTANLGKQFNANHIDLKQLNARLENTYYDSKTIQSHVRQFNLYSDDHLVKASGKFLMNDSIIQLNEGKVGLDNTEINAAGQLIYSNQELLAPESRVNLNLNETTIFLKDLDYLLPVVEKINYNEPVELTGAISGTFADLDVRNFNLELDSTSLTVKGKLYNLDRIDELAYSVDQFVFTSGQDAIQRLLPDSLKPLPVMLPSTFSLELGGNGSLNSFKGEAELLSSIGNLQLKVDSLILMDSIPAYDIRASTKGFDVGSFIDLNGDLDSLAFNMQLSGTGATLATMKSNLGGTFRHLTFNNYSYDSIQTDIQFIKGLIDGSLMIIDPNLSLNLTADADLSSELYQNAIRLELDKANLGKLNFSNTPLSLEGVLTTNFATTNFKRFNGDFAIRNFKANNGIDTYRVDSLLVASVDQEGKTEISIDSDIMEGKFEGNIDLFTVSDALLQHVDRYYKLAGLPEEPTEDTRFTFDFNLKRTDLITEILVPQLSEFDPGRFSARFNSQENKLDVNLSLHHLTYSGVSVDSFKLMSSSEQNLLSSSFTIDRIHSANIEVNNLALRTALENNELATKLSLKDSTGRYQYLIKGLFQSIDSLYQFTLSKDSLILAYEKWTVDQSSPFLIDPSGGNDNVNLKISNKGQEIDIETNASDTNLEIGFNQFQLTTLSEAIRNNEELISGELNGQLTLIFPDSTLGVLADLNINRLSVLKKKWGDFNLNIEQQNQTNYAAKLRLISSKNDLEAKAVYDLDNINDLQLTLDVQKFQLATVAPILRENIKDLTGVLSGQISLDGGFSTPDLNGSLKFSETKFNPVALNNTLSVDQEDITIKNSKFLFNEFKLSDKQNNTAYINGNIELIEPAFYKLNVSVTTDDFLILNTTKEDNNLFYGAVRTDGKASITGSTARPNIKLDLKLSDDTEFTYLVPETEFNNMSNDGIVQFVSVKEEDLEEPEDLLRDSLAFQGLNLTTKLEINKSSKFNIVIDPITEDQLTVQGAATLNLAINRRGDIQLSGRYTVDKGSYNFSFYKLLKREFSIQKGSSITWSGDPYEARMDIRASNRVEAPPIDLMITQIQNTSGSNLERYKQRLPFLVYLDIQGELMKPEISFELDMPQAQRNAFGGAVYARILDLNTRESDLNKQVFALLLLQRFISEDPLRSEAGYDVEDRARRSVSRILSDQLNRLTDNIEGVNLSFDLQSYQDYSTGAAEATTQLELGVSKTLFDDKLEVKVSGNVNLEGQRQQGFADYIGDLALEYKITEDGRLRITGFRRSDFDVLSGEIVETGAGVIYVRDYNTFKELFKVRDNE